ncbi:hypothetical protein Tco_0390568 [Tanacetum coccineum]
MAEMFGLLKNLTTTRVPKKVLIREEAKSAVTKNVNSISLARGKEESNDDNDVVTGDKIKKTTRTEMEVSVKEAEIKNGAENKPIKKAEKEEAVEAPSSQLIEYYLKHRINEKLIEGLVGNHTFNDSLSGGRENEKRPFILGTSLLTMDKAAIKFDKGTITLRSGKNKISFNRIPEYLCKDEKGIKNDIEPIAPTMTVNKLVLEWEEKIKIHQEKEMEFDRLYLTRKSLEVLRKFHWMILGGRFNQLSHVSSLLLSKPGEYKVFNWETAKYGKIWYDEEVHDLRSVETEFLAIVFNDNLTSNETLSYEPTVSSLNNNEIDFRISFDESDDEDYTVVFDKNSFSYKIISINDLKTDSENDNEKVNMPLFPSPEPSVSCIDDLDFFKDFENEFPAIVYNDALTSKSDFSTEPTFCPQHIDEFDLKDERHYKDNDDNEIDMIQSSGGNENTQGSNKLLEASHDKINKVFIMKSFVIKLNVNIMAWNYLVNGMLFNLIKNLYVPFSILFDPKWYYKDGDPTRMLRRPSWDHRDYLHERVEFQRISLIGFCSCTSRSHYRSVSKQTTRYPFEASHGHKIEN